ncbi:sulfonate ABC transporter substrate-binding protein [Nostoc sp. ATCC 53789]|uniref:sulfonate ABC transporter substrate-binding protein n=1 Tax=Nostoc sp. ATCC 53789 TaxID=76335 RepID=UPI000DECE219|nr:sulfonate ABC transporter substrate-binding protein [Nostoc sp. ATCC 53789]QHG16882.1 aliphatic sulfonate ABC transporter substrate-binding protein [Nostoc sp. ATCC 53789]RCJ31132.1 ABC transporter substrate-binding protein [Nostoc sp. ATCC 53789]
MLSNTVIKTSPIIRRFALLVMPGFLALSTTLISCTSPNGNTNSATEPKADPAATKTIALKTKVLRMGYQSSGDLVRVRGVLEKRLEPLGVKVEWAQFAQGPQLMEAMNVGKIDVGSVGETPPIFAQAAGARIVYLAGRRITATSGKGSAIVVPKGSPIKSLVQIKGQKVVFQKGSASHYFIIKALEEVGLKYSDIQVLSMPNVEARGAFIQGTIPVWVTGDPHLALVEKLHGARVLRDATNIGTPGGYYVGTREFAKENPELLRIILEEIDKNGQWAETNRQEVAKLIAPVLKIDLPIQEIISGRANYRLKGITPELMKAQQSVADLFYNEKILPKKIDVQEALLTSKEYAAITPPTLISEK